MTVRVRWEAFAFPTGLDDIFGRSAVPGRPLELPRAAFDVGIVATAASEFNRQEQYRVPYRDCAWDPDAATSNMSSREEGYIL